MRLIGAEVFAQWVHKRFGSSRKLLMLMPFNATVPDGDEIVSPMSLSIRLFNEDGCIGELRVDIPHEWLR